MNPTHAALIAAGCALLSAIVTAWIGSRSAHEANEIGEYKATIEGMQATIAGMKTLQDAQGGRISTLETELTLVKAALVDEQRGHGETRGLFRVATKLIRDWRSWFESDRSTEPAPVPPKLADWL